MHVITTTLELSQFCSQLAGNSYVAVDTEFMRERTYYPLLCLVQVAGEDAAAAIDPLADGLDLAPLHALLADPRLCKVFHASRQDLEIFYQQMGAVPAPVFDTQIAAQVCGFGESASYESLVNTLLGETLDKSARFTDWSHRPLSERQLAYAISDVTHLRHVYEKLRGRIEQTQRTAWIREEMEALADPRQYVVRPDEAWQRLRHRSKSRKFLATLQAVARWRELEAQRHNVPRGRILKDEVVLEVAARAPHSLAEFAKLRGMGGALSASRQQSLIDAIEAVKAMPPEEYPRLPEKAELPSGSDALMELLRVLLKLQCEKQHVAQRLVASREDLEAIAMGLAGDTPVMHGWRYELFGNHAKKLMEGRLAFTFDPANKTLKVLDL